MPLLSPAHVQHAQTRAVLEIGAALALTSLHHVYDTIHYTTPWRYHAVVLSLVVLALILSAFVLGQARPDPTAGRMALWVFWVVSFLGPVLLIGGFEGVYNHVGKNALYFGGLPEARMRSLFPPPTYEMPNDLLFEVTGILQAFPAGMAAYHLALRTLQIETRHLGVLTALAGNEALNQKQFMEQLELDKSSVVLIIDDLERLGLAERRPDPQDRRAHAVQSTGQGQKSLRAAQRIAELLGRKVFAGLNQNKRKLLDLALWRIIRNCEGLHKEKRS